MHSFLRQYSRQRGPASWIRDIRYASPSMGHRNGLPSGCKFPRSLVLINKVCAPFWPSCSRKVSTLQSLDEMVRSGALQPDRSQKRVAKKLSRLQEVLVDYDNSVLFRRQESRESGEDDEKSLGEKDEECEKKANVSKVRKNEDNDVDDDASSSQPTPSLKIPRGIYIWGNVGTGKTMLMDSFYENATVGGVDRKRRFHFHDFLSMIHARIHSLKKIDLEERGRNFSIDTSLANNPIHKVALEFSSEVSLLCLDEFQVTDIADAVILSQLFSVLFLKGTVVVATSNRPPRDLYEGGLNRSYFLPFIDLLERHCITHHIPSQRDYRRIMSNCSSFFVHLETKNGNGDGGDQMEAMVSQLARELVGTDGVTDLNVENEIDCNDPTTPRPMKLPVGFQRSIIVDRVYGGDADNRPRMACFSFRELCDTDKGSMDYRAIAHAFDIIVLESIPTMDLEGHNRARRFITLIDELYEAKCALLCFTLTAKSPMELFRITNHDNTLEGDLDNRGKKPRTDSNKNMQESILDIDVAQEGGTPVGALASVRELSFAFERSSSRIFEMCSRSWWEKVLIS